MNIKLLIILAYYAFDICRICCDVSSFLKLVIFIFCPLSWLVWLETTHFWETSLIFFIQINSFGFINFFKLFFYFYFLCSGFHDFLGGDGGGYPLLVSRVHSCSSPHFCPLSTEIQLPWVVSLHLQFLKAVSLWGLCLGLPSLLHGKETLSRLVSWVNTGLTSFFTSSLVHSP